MTAEGSRGEEGFVLVSVVMVLAAVSAVLAAALMQMRADTALARTRADITHLQGMADGLTRLVALDLAVGRTYRMGGLGLPEDGTTVACPLSAGRTAFIALEDQGRLIDLNRTARPAMEEAFRALGIPDRDALSLSAEIVDYRDPDDVPEPSGGAELPQYRARGLAYGPRNGPFLSVDEIARLPSMTPPFAAMLQPALTVYNEGGGFDLAALVRRLRPSVAPAQAEGGKRVPSPRQYFRMAITVASGSARAGRVAVYALGGTRTGTNFLAWQPGHAPPGPAVAHGACPAIRAALEMPL